MQYDPVAVLHYAVIVNLLLIAALGTNWNCTSDVRFAPGYLVLRIKVCPCVEQ